MFRKRIFIVLGVGLSLLMTLVASAAEPANVDTFNVQGDSTEVNLVGDGPLAPALMLTLTPYNPPIVIPASGGTFQSFIEAKNMENDPFRFDIWTSIMKPDGSEVNPAGGPYRVNIPGGWNVGRDDLIQEIGAGDPAGTYTYYAHVGRFPDRIVASESFTFEKLAGGGWYPQSSGTSDWLFDIHFADADNGWAVGQTNEIVHTTNGGDTWMPQSTPVFSNFWTVFAADAQNAWAGGSLGVIIHTTDGGANWTLQDGGVSGSYAWQGMYFLDADNGWVVGGKPYDFTASRRVVIHTTDGGANWETQYSVSNETPLNAVHFVDANNGWAVGDGSGILHTSDGGDTWVEQTTGVGDYFDDVYFIDVNNGWVVGDDGTVAQTTDGGATWTIHDLGASNDLTGVHFADANNGWVSGIDQTNSQAIILHTDDGGVTWHDQDPGPVTILYNLSFVDATNGWAAGDNGAIIHTDTGGE